MNIVLIHHYFSLQHRRLERHLIDFGLWPKLGQLLAVAAFFSFVLLIQRKTIYASYILCVFAGLFLVKTSDKQRNDFLKIQFSSLDYRMLRVLENVLLAIPFVLGLVYYQAYLMAGILILLSTSMVWVQINISSSYVIPTPFGKYPFESIVGFRKSFILIVLSYFILYQGIRVENINLAFSSLGIVLITVISFYLVPEHIELVRIFRRSPSTFLLHKLKIALSGYLLLITPIIFTLSYNFLERYLMIIFLILLSCCYVSAVVLAKYAKYPKNMSLPYTLFIILAFIFPPLLLFLIPHFYSLAIKSLRVFV